MSKSSEEGAVDNSAPQDGSGEAGAQKDANASIYENRAGTKKIVRVVTVMAYVFSVSFTAILLSAYYVFIWEPPNPRMIQRSHLLSDPQAQYLADYSLNSLNSRANVSEKLLTIPEILNQDEQLNSPKTMIAGSDSDTLTNNPQRLVAPTPNFFELHQSVSSSALIDDSRSSTRSTLTGVPFFHIAETISTTAEKQANMERDSSGGIASVSMTPTIFLYATSRATEVTEKAATEEGEGTSETVLANVGNIVDNYIDPGTDLYAPDNTSFIKEREKFDKFSESFKSSVNRDENRDEARDFRGRANGTTDFEAKENDTRDAKSLLAISTNGKTTSSTPKDMGAIIYRRLRLKLGDTIPPGLIDDKVNDKATTGNPTTTTEESMPEESLVAHQLVEELREQDEAEAAETKREELVYGEDNAREIMKNRK